MNRSFLIGILIAAIIVIIMLMGLEILVRIIVPSRNDVLHQCHPLYGSTGIPGVTGNFYGMIPEAMTVSKVVVNMNSKGLRDREYQYEKHNSFRILMLGDSMVEAMQVPLDLTCQEVLESILNNHLSGHSNIEVISGAHAGWGTDNEYLFYCNEGYKYQPDIVLLALFPWNDVRNNSRDLQMVMGESIDKPSFTLDKDNILVLENFPFPCDASSRSYNRDSTGKTLHAGEEGNRDSAMKSWLASHSRLYLFVKGRFRLLLSQKIIDLLIGWGFMSPSNNDSVAQRRFEIGHGVFYKEMPLPLQSAWTLTEKLVLALRGEVVHHGGQFAVVVIPSIFEVNDFDWQRVQKEAFRFGIVDLDRRKPSRMVIEFCTQHNIPILDTLPEFERHTTKDKDPLFFKGDGHLTKAGNYLLAKMLASWLTESALISVRTDKALPKLQFD